MRKGILDVLKGKFLVSGDAPKNWLFIIFISFLATVMIGSQLRSEFVDLRSDVQRLKLESTITKTVEKKGLFPSETPPKKIKVKSIKE